MSITAGRVYLALTGAVSIICVLWFALAWSRVGPWSGATVAPATIGLVAIVALIVGALLFPRFSDVSVSGTAITIPRVMAPPRVVPVSQLDEVVVLQTLLLPARTGSTSAQRVLLRHEGRTIAAFTPRDRNLTRALESRGLTPVVVSTALTPLQAHRRFRGSVSVVELMTIPAAWLAVVVPVAVVIWVVLDAGGG